MIFTADRLAELWPQPVSDPLRTIASALETHAPAYGVNRLLRRAHFIAQVAHESSGFGRLTENLNYRAERIAAVFPKLAGRAVELEHRPEALANAAYGSTPDKPRLGNGDEASGDGWKYRGRGLIQLTGKANYRDRGASLGIDLVGSPRLAAEPETACLIALGYWRSRGCNEAADLDDVEKVTRLINGGVIGLTAREELTERAKLIFREQPSEGLIA